MAGVFCLFCFVVLYGCSVFPITCYFCCCVVLGCCVGVVYVSCHRKWFWEGYICLLTLIVVSECYIIPVMESVILIKKKYLYVVLDCHIGAVTVKGCDGCFLCSLCVCFVLMGCFYSLLKNLKVVVIGVIKYDSDVCASGHAGKIFQGSWKSKKTVKIPRLTTQRLIVGLFSHDKH